MNLMQNHNNNHFILMVYFFYLHKSITPLVFGIMMYFVYTVYQIWNQYDSINISVKPNCKTACHLEWSWLTPNKYVPFFLYLFVYLALLIYPLYIVKDRRSVLMITIPVLTLLYSLYRFSETNAWGSHWCSSINLWSLVAIFMWFSLIARYVVEYNSKYGIKRRKTEGLNTTGSLS